MQHRSPDLRRRGAHALPSRQDLAIEVLAFLAGDAERLGRFMALTGSTPETLRQSAASRTFADAVLSYLASDESLLVAFAAAADYPPERVGAVVGDSGWEG